MIGLVKLEKGVSFDEAVNWLAAQTGEYRQAPSKYRKTRTWRNEEMPKNMRENTHRSLESPGDRNHAGKYRIRPGMLVHAADRDNYGKVRSVTGRKAVVYFWNKEKGYSATVGLDTDLLTPARAPESNHPVPELEEEPILDEGPVPEVLEGYLDGCRPLEGQVLDYLLDRGIATEVVQHLMIRFCGKEYEDLIKSLEDRFGKGALISTGLLTRGKKGYYPTFGPYFWKQVGFLVILTFETGSQFT